MLLWFYALIAFNYIGMFCLVFQYVNALYFILHSILTLLLLLVISMLSKSNPGYVNKNDNLDFMKLLETGQLDKVWVVCELALTSRIKHWRICNKCVENFDHHCPWIDNCVGLRNHNLFFVLLWLLFWFLLFNILVSIIHVQKFDEFNNSFIYIGFLRRTFNHEWVYRVFLIVNIMGR